MDMNIIQILKDSLLVFFLILNLVFAIRIRKLSLRLGGNPPRFFFYTFLAYIREQSKKPGNEKLRLWVVLHNILLFVTIISFIAFFVP